MSTIEVVIHYRNIDFVSDRTARETLKRFSKIIRRAQVLEIKYVLSRQSLRLAEVQSSRFKTIAYLESAPLMAIQAAEKGSWKIVATLGAFGLWFLELTIGSSIQDGYRKTELHRDIVHYVQNLRPKKIVKFIKEALEDEKFEGRWEVADVVVKSKKNRTRCVITLSPTVSSRKKSHDFIDGDYVIKECKKKIAAAEERQLKP